jgi:RES domain-containing protein
MLEVLVHLKDRDGDLPRTFVLLEIAASEELALENVVPPEIGNWKLQEKLTHDFWDAWLAGKSTPLARVPSAIVPRTWNVLLNPLHPAAKGAEVVSVNRERYGNRLFHFGPR